MKINEDVLDIGRREHPRLSQAPYNHSRTTRCPVCGDTLYTNRGGQWRHFETQRTDCDTDDDRWATPLWL